MSDTAAPHAQGVPNPAPSQVPPERLVSIIVPVKNQGRTLKILLDRLKTLKPPPGWGAEIIAVYSDSRDDTLEVLRASGVRVLTCDLRGPGPARNAGAKAARGALLYFIDADACPVGDDFLARLISIAVRLKRFGAFGGAILPTPSQLWNPVALGDHWACWFNWAASRPAQQSRLFQPTVSAAVPRGVFEALGGFDPAILILEDFELEQRMMRRGLPVYYVPQLAVTHHARGSLLRSWRHSWSWGGPFRSTYLARNPGYKLWFPVGHRLFALNLPLIFWRRTRLVLRAAWANSKWQACYGFPFLAATVLAWAIAVAVGADQPTKSDPGPI
jgi:GT2 family glycosyltransferase